MVPADNFTDKINAAAVKACGDGRCVTEDCKHEPFRLRVEELIKASLAEDAETGFTGYSEVTVHRCKPNGWFPREPRGHVAYFLLLAGATTTVMLMTDTNSGPANMVGTALMWLVISGVAALFVLFALIYIGAVEKEAKIYRTESRQCHVRGGDGLRFDHTSHGQLVWYGLGDKAVHDRHDGWHLVNVADIPSGKRPQVIKDLQC